MAKRISRRNFLKAAGALGGAAAAVGGVPAIVKDLAFSKTPIKIGMTLPFSKAYKTYGDRVSMGVKYAFATSKWGENVEFILEDTQIKPAVARRKAEKLIFKDGVHMLAGPVAGHTAMAVGQYANRKGHRPVLMAYGGNIKFVGEGCGPYSFLVGHNTWNMAAPAAPVFYNEVSKVAALTGAEYSTGHDITTNFAVPYKKLGGEIIGGEGVFAPIGTSDYSPYLLKLQKLDPPAIFFAYYAQDCVNFIKQAGEMGFQRRGVKFMGGLGNFLQVLLPAMGDAAIGGMDIFHYTPWLENEANQKFLAGYKKWNPEGIIDTSVVLGYDVGRFMTTALEATNGDTDPKALVLALEKAKIASPRGEVSFDVRHVSIIPVYIRKVVKEDGQLKVKVWKNLGRIETPGDAVPAAGKCVMKRP